MRNREEKLKSEDDQSNIVIYLLLRGMGLKRRRGR